MKGDDPQIDTAQTLKRFNGRLALQEKIQKTFADRIPNNYRLYFNKSYYLENLVNNYNRRILSDIE